MATYVKALNQLNSFLLQQGMPSDVSAIRREHIEAFLVALQGSGQRPATVANRYRSLQQVFRWLVNEDENAHTGNLSTQLHAAGASSSHLPVQGGRSLWMDGYRSRCELNERLVDDLRARHPDAIERLLDEYGRLLQAVAFHVLRSHADAEEVVIDSMVTAWQRIGSLRDPAALRPWLLRIATRHALARRRRTVPTHALLDGSLPAPSGAADPERIALAEALDHLPPRMRACLSLHYYAGLSVSETATALGISPNTAKFHLKTGLERLRAALEVEPIPAPGTSTEP